MAIRPSVIIPRFHCLPAGFNRAGFNVANGSLPTIFNAVRAASWRHTYFTGRNCLADAGMKFNREIQK